MKKKDHGLAVLIRAKEGAMNATEGKVIAWSSHLGISHPTGGFLISYHLTTTAKCGGGNGDQSDKLAKNSWLLARASCD